jgi:hypothetical protein
MFKLNNDETVGGTSVCAGIEIKILLDSTGNVSTSPAQSIWGTDVMSPANAYYRVTGYSAVGQIAWGPNNQQVTTGTTFDLNTWTPNQVISWSPPVSTPILQTNSTNNATQTQLNLVQGTNISLTNVGAAVTIAVTGITSTILQTNSVSNSVQSLLNVVAGANITLTAGTSGNVTISAANTGPTLAASATGPFFIGPGIMTGQLPSISAGGGLVAGVANAIRVCRFVLPVGMVIGRASWNRISNANGVYSFGVYSADGSTKILDSGVQSATSTTSSIVTSTFAGVSVAAGTYWFAQTDQSNSGGASVAVLNASYLTLLTGPSGSPPVAGARNIIGRSATASTSGVLPSSISVSSLTYDSDNTIAAVIWESQ